MTNIRSLLFYCICFLTTFFQSCEGFKILTIENKLDENIYLQTKPEINYLQGKSNDVKSPFKAAHGNYVILPDSSIRIRSNFTSLLFNKKFRQDELTIEYLLIATSTDTIIARNKKEIIDLINNSTNKQNNSGAKNYIVDNKRNLITIIASQ